MGSSIGYKSSSNILRTNSGGAKFIVILLLLASAGYWYWNYFRPSSKPGAKSVLVQAPALTSPQSSAPAKQEPTYDNAQDYARKNVFFAGVLEGKLDKPGLILRFDNRGDRELSNLSVQVIGYKEFYIQDISKAEGTEYTVDLEVKSFPAKKVTETVLYFPPGVQSINRKITVYDARF